VTIKELIDQFDLTHTHTLFLRDASLVFEKVGDSTNRASVYVWVASKAGSDCRVLYVGKAGKGVDLRCTQHMGGFVNSGTGRKNASELKRYLDAGYDVRVYARESSVMEIFGQAVSLYSAEEDALCAALSPVMNRAVFPAVDARTDKESVVQSTTTPRASMEVVGYLINGRLVQSTAVSTDDLSAQLDAYTDDQRLAVKKLLMHIEETHLEPEHRAKLIGGYTGHPKGCSGRTTLTYAIPGPSGRMNAGTWKARVYFSDQPRVGFPLTRLKSTARSKVDISESAGTFSPQSTDDFNKHPDDYLV